LIEIFSHRAIFNSKENTLDGLKYCLKNGFAVELDLQYNDFVYLSHDQTNSGPSFEDACKIIKNSKSKVSLHLKERQAISHVSKLILESSIQNQCFLFMTQHDYSTVRRLVDKEIQVANYSNKRPQATNTRILWCDESGEKWYDEKIILQLHVQKKFLIAMSPELLYHVQNGEIESEWRRLMELGFDGLCTDFPERLLEFSKKMGLD